MNHKYIRRFCSGGSVIKAMVCSVTVSLVSMAINECRAYAEPSTLPIQAELNEDSTQGWSMTGLTGFTSCLPSGNARCDGTYPGINLGLSTEYRWKYIGILANLDWGTLTPLGTGSDHVTHRLGHFGLGGRAYMLQTKAKVYYAGASMGAGEAIITDTQSDSLVSWSSYWSDVRLEIGGLWMKTETLALESAFSLTIHLGGERCLRFNGAGPCTAEADLEESENSSARVLMWRIGVRWIP